MVKDFGSLSQVQFQTIGLLQEAPQNGHLHINPLNLGTKFFTRSDSIHVSLLPLKRLEKMETIYTTNGCSITTLPSSRSGPGAVKYQAGQPGDPLSDQTTSAESALGVGPGAFDPF